MTAAGGMIIGQQIGNHLRQVEEKRKLEQEQAQRYQQICQQRPIYIPDKFEFVSQVPQSPMNRPTSLKFGVDTDDEGTYDPLTDPIKKRKANEARARWREAKGDSTVSDKTRRGLLYDRYNQEEKAEKSARGVSRNSTMVSGGIGLLSNKIIPDPTFNLGVGVTTAVASSGVTEPLGVVATNIGDGLYKLVRPKSPERSNITRKVDTRMSKLEAERKQKREDELRDARLLELERKERLRQQQDEERARGEQTKKSSSWFSW